VPDLVPDDNRPATHRFCPGCGAEATAGTSFCGACGHSLANGATITPPEETSTGLGSRNTGSESTDSSAEPVDSWKHRNKVTIIAVVAILIVAGGAISALVVTESGSGGGGVVATPKHVAVPTSTSTNPASTTTAAAATATTTSGPVALPVVECPTTRGVQGSPPSVYPSSIAVSIDPSLAPQVAYYSDDTRSLAPVMGPAGWSCGVEVGADGSTVVAIYPSAESGDFTSRLLPQPFTASSDQAVVAYSPSACQGCIYDLVCPLITDAGQQLGYSQPCLGTKPDAESVDWLNGSPDSPISLSTSDQISFADPPGVSGDGTPSGGAYTANGVINYIYNPSSEGSASSITCTLPDSQHTICSAILNDFDNRNWPSSGTGG
jgi:hypothetical protein